MPAPRCCAPSTRWRALPRRPVDRRPSTLRGRWPPASRVPSFDMRTVLYGTSITFTLKARATPASPRASAERLLGIHLHGLARRDAEELRVEEVNVTEEPAPTGVHLARSGGIGVVIGINAPQVLWHLDNRASAAAAMV